jgi:hypothetical protein
MSSNLFENNSLLLKDPKRFVSFICDDQHPVIGNKYRGKTLDKNAIGFFKPQLIRLIDKYISFDLPEDFTYQEYVELDNFMSKYEL